MTDSRTSRCPQVTIVIVSYQSLTTIDNALASVRSAHQAGLVECVVVDNASSDGTSTHITDHWPWVTLIESGANLGFGRGCNLGFESTRTPYVLFLNPDAAIGVGAVTTLITFMESHPKAAIAAPAILDDNGRLQHSGLLLTPGVLLRAALGSSIVHSNGRPIVPGEAAYETDWLCGAIMLMRSEDFKSVGGFDPRFFLYFEETDLCLRLRQAGKELWAVGEAVAHHSCGVSAKESGEDLASGCIAEHYYRSRYYYLVKQYGWFRATAAETLATAISWSRRRLKAWSGRTLAPATANAPRPFLKMPDPVEQLRR